MIPSSPPLTSRDLATQLGAELIGDENLEIHSISDLATASSCDVSFFHNEKYRGALQRSHAGAVIASSFQPDTKVAVWLIHENPSLAFQRAIKLFHPPLDTFPYEDIHPTAFVDNTASLGEGVCLGPHCTIGPRVIIGSNSYIGPGVVIGADVTLGSDCVIHANVVIRESCHLGHRVHLQPQVTIGSCGFGYNTQEGKHVKLEQLGNVIIEDDVEIGSGSCIDRGRFKPTRIGRGSKIDNLVMIAHGVEIGEDNLIVAQVGVAGSTKTGRWVVLGGQVGVAGHLEIGNGVQVAAQSGVTKDLKEGVFGGTPAHPLRQWHEQQAHLNSIARLKTQLKELNERMNALESIPPS